MNKIQIYNSIGTDELSKVRGLGRYYKTLERAVVQISAETKHDNPVLINPFFNMSGKPWFGVLGSGGKKIAVIHDVIPLKYPAHFPVGIKGKAWQFANWSLLPTYNAFVTDSVASKNDILHHLGIPQNKVHIAYPYSLLPREVTHGSLPPGIEPQKYLLYVGDVNWHKNIGNIARACVQAKVKLVCVGKAFMQPITDNPWLDELEEFLRVAALNPELITRLGYVDNETLTRLYTHAIANVLVSRDEGFGYSYVEAGMCGTPSILADRPIFHEISDRSGAVFVDPEKVDTISGAIHTLMRDENVRKALGVAAHNRCRFFNEQSFTAEWRAILASYG